MQSMTMTVIRDSKAEAFNLPMLHRTIEEAKRQFSLHVNEKNQDNLLNLYPEDYDLYEIGSYNQKTGTLEKLDTPLHITKAISLVKKEASPSVQPTKRRK